MPSDPAEVAVDPRTGMGELGGGAEVVCVSGHIDLRDGGDLLRRALPELIHMRATAVEAPVLGRLTAELMEEMAGGRPGSHSSSDHLAQLMFAQVLRACLGEAAGPLPG
ncbi:cupin domain-containing protein [Streptomyces sp. NPDC007905]|uniref:cupin domain-containing protein n=1 Tax=Streptomyces sp. NPDC007905 TaxID=3364788 RepID=UPI0036E29059